MIRAESNLGVYASLSELVALQHQARGFSFLPGQPIHSLLAGRHASRLRGRGLDFEELRHYQFGDDVRQIDWKATNRTRKTQVRVYTEERERAVLLVVDQRLKMFFGSQRNMKSVTAAEAAGLAAWRVIFVKDRVGAVVFNDSAIVEICPRRSRGTVMQILGAVLKQNHALAIDAGIVSQAAMLNEALRRVDRLATHDMLVCLITDGYGADKETERLTTRIARHNDVLVTFIYDPLEAELPVAGPLVFSEGKRQLEVDTRSKRLRTAFRASFDERVQRAHKFLLQREVPLIPISTAEDVAAQLRRLLGQAAPRFTARTEPHPARATPHGLGRSLALALLR
jgi:uncharacterized protein (DUF58 family)